MSTVREYLADNSRDRQAEAAIFDGMRVEVFDQEQRPLFEASLEKISDRLAVLRRTSELFRDDFMEAFEDTDDPAEVSVRGFYAPRNIGVFLRGWLYPLPQGSSEQWMFQDITVTGTDQGRAHYRTILKAVGWTAAGDVPPAFVPPQEPAAPVTDKTPADPAWTPCSITNASTGGVRLRTETALEVGDRVWLYFKLRRGKEQPPLRCEVRSAAERDGVFEYGCKFADRSPETDNTIVRTIIELQIMQS